MDHQAYFQTLAAYHCMANRRLLRALEPVGDADYYGDQGLFFKSIHRTLNHILLVDRLYHGRITGELFDVTGLDQELVHDRRELAVDMERHGERWKDVLDGIDATRMQSVLRYLSTEGEQRELPMLVVLAHAFNHATHHRGQVSAAMTRLGQPAPVLDIPYALADLKTTG
ncbi:MAG TPA: DinB family protein [Gammaproteobacteria bacterium]|nr:DinB family protein [Gammaproteobacteria bacterium]